MKSYALAISIIYCNCITATIAYDCSAEKALPGYTVRDFQPLMLVPRTANKISILRTIEIAGSEISMDEQFLNVKPTRCRIPGKGGKKFASAGMENNSTNGYRVDPAIFTKKAPAIVRISFVLDRYNNGKKCVPAVYKCLRRYNF